MLAFAVLALLALAAPASAEWDGWVGTVSSEKVQITAAATVRTNYTQTSVVTLSAPGSRDDISRGVGTATVSSLTDYFTATVCGQHRLESTIGEGVIVGTGDLPIEVAVTESAGGYSVTALQGGMIPVTNTTEFVTGPACVFEPSITLVTYPALISPAFVPKPLADPDRLVLTRTTTVSCGPTCTGTETVNVDLRRIVPPIIRVIKDLEPADDPGRFDLTIDGEIVAEAVGDEGMSGLVTVGLGEHIVSEGSAVGVDGRATNLDSYASSIRCWDSATLTSVGETVGRSIGVHVDEGDSVVCSILNTEAPPPTEPCVPPLAPGTVDTDSDCFPDANDKCPQVFDRDQRDNDEDGSGDACDPIECQVFPGGTDGFGGFDSCALQPGDLLLRRGTSLNSNLESAFGDTFYSHAAIVIGRMDIDRRDPDLEIVIADAQPDDGGESVSLRDIDDSDFNGEHPEILTIQAYRLALPESVRRDAAQLVLDRLLTGGADQALNQRPEVWSASNLHYEIFPPTGGRGPVGFYCSGLIWWAYQQLGVDLDPIVVTFLEDPYVTPDDLIESTRDDEPAAVPVGGSAGEFGSVAVYSPAHVLLVDPMGRRSGMAADGTIHDEIPNAIWNLTPHSESVSVPHLTTDWEVRLSGYDTGRYTLLWRQFTGTTFAPRVIVPGFAKAGMNESYRLHELAVLAGRPLAVEDAATTQSAVPIDIDVLGNDSDEIGAGLDRTTLRVSVNPTNGIAEPYGLGMIRYTPAAGFVGEDSFEYEICDGDRVCSTAVVKVSVEQTSTTFTVNVRFTDGNPGSVSIALVCSSGDVEPTSVTTSSADPAAFNVTGYTAATTCTATENPVPGGYTQRNEACQSVPIAQGICTITNEPIVQPPIRTAIVTSRATPCGQVQAGTATDITEVLYTTSRNGAIQRPRPQYFVYWTQVTAPAASFTLQIDQTNDLAGFPLYSANNPTLHKPGCAGEARLTVTKTNAKITVAVRSATAGSVYWLAVKYSTAPVERQRLASSTTLVTTSLLTSVNGLGRPETLETMVLRQK
jgi:hypothetical protein